MIYIIQAYLLPCLLFLAGKDATSYLLKDKKDNALSAGRVQRWHRDGFVLYALFTLACIDKEPILWWKTLIVATLLRLSLFDLCFNRWASLPITYLGGTAWADRQFVRVFGINGAIKKSATFLLLLALLNLLNVFL